MDLRGRGALLAVGGGEDKRDAMVILRRALDDARRAPRVALLPTASADPLWSCQLHLQAFRRLGAEHVDVVDVRDREQAALEENVERILAADVVYMTGGDQSRLAWALEGTPLHEALGQLLDEGGLVAGTSAGAAAMSRVMISEGDTRLRKGDVRLTPGLSLLPGAIVDTHFSERGRFSRLLEAVAGNPTLMGIGLGEDTAIHVRGDEVEVVGSGSVVLMDGAEIRHSNIEHAEPGEPVDVHRVILHSLSGGACFRLRQPPTGRSPAHGRAWV